MISTDQYEKYTAIEAALERLYSRLCHTATNAQFLLASTLAAHENRDVKNAAYTYITHTLSSRKVFVSRFAVKQAAAIVREEILLQNLTLWELASIFLSSTLTNITPI